nr:hypothetical protein HmN_000978300 [Hymenolepis microstoma]
MTLKSPPSRQPRQPGRGGLAVNNSGNDASLTNSRRPEDSRSVERATNVNVVTKGPNVILVFTHLHPRTGTGLQRPSRIIALRSPPHLSVLQGASEQLTSVVVCGNSIVTVRPVRQVSTITSDDGVAKLDLGGPVTLGGTLELEPLRTDSRSDQLR